MTLDDLPDLRPALRRVLGVPTPSGALPGLGAAPASPFAFSPDPARRQGAVAEVARLMATRNPEGAEALRGADVFAALGEAMTALRLTQDWQDQARALGENYRALGRDLLGLDLGLFTLDERGLVARSDAGFVG